METKLVLHAKTNQITVYSTQTSAAHLLTEKAGSILIKGGVSAYVQKFVQDHNADESAHPYIQELIDTKADESDLIAHTSDTNNPHAVTKAQVGLGNADNTSDLEKPISTATQAALDAKQATISDLETIRSGAALGATAVQPGDLATVATTGDYDDLTNKPTIPSQASDVHALPDTTKYGASLDLNINSSTYVVTAQLKDQDGNALGTAQTIDLPLESVVVSGSYDSTNKKVILTLQNGSTVEFSVADLVAGLQSEITSSNKLSADLVDDTSTTNKFVTSVEKSTWDDKQDAISDLATIRSGAALGATSVQQSDIADVYRENNLIPETPVEFNAAVSTDYYTTTGNATITNGILTAVSSGNDCYANTSISDFNKLEMVFKAKRYTWSAASQILPICAFGSGSSNRRLTPNASSDATGGTRLFNGSTIVVNIPNSYFDLQTYGPLGYYTRLKVTKNTSDYTYELGLSADGKTWVTNSANYSTNMCTGAVYFLRNSSGAAGSNGEMDLNETYIKVDGEYFVPPLSATIVSVPAMTGATSSAAGTKGLVPAPAAGDEAKFLRGDGTWVGSTSSSAWGSITGTLSDQTDLQTALNTKADDSNTVHKTGNETIAGQKDFTDNMVIVKQNPYLYNKSSTLQRGTYISDAGEIKHVAWDKDSKLLSEIRTYIESNDGSTSLCLAGATQDSGGTQIYKTFLRGTVKPDGTSEVSMGNNTTIYGVTPATSDNSTKFATTEWVRDILEGLNMLGRMDFNSVVTWTFYMTISGRKITNVTVFTVPSDGYIRRQGQSSSLLGGYVENLKINNIVIPNSLDYNNFIPVSQGDLVTLSYDTGTITASSGNAYVYQFFPERS